MNQPDKSLKSTVQSLNFANQQLAIWHVHLKGDWTRHESYRILNIFQRLREQSGDIAIPSLFNHQGTILHHSGRSGRVGFTRGGDIFLDEDWTDWTFAHELGHRWNNAWARQPELNLRKAVGAGKLEWLKKGIRQLTKWAEKFLHRLSAKSQLDWPALWYHPGDAPPPCGVDRNFNASEDLAECFAAMIFQEEARKRAEKAAERFRKIGERWNWPAHFTSFSATPRGQVLIRLLKRLSSKEIDPKETGKPASQDQQGGIGIKQYNEHE